MFMVMVINPAHTGPRPVTSIASFCVMSISTQEVKMGERTPKPTGLVTSFDSIGYNRESDPARQDSTIRSRATPGHLQGHWHLRDLTRALSGENHIAEEKGASQTPGEGQVGRSCFPGVVDEALVGFDGLRFLNRHHHALLYTDRRGITIIHVLLHVCVDAASQRGGVA